MTDREEAAAIPCQAPREPPGTHGAAPAAPTTGATRYLPCTAGYLLAVGALLLRIPGLPLLGTLGMMTAAPVALSLSSRLRGWAIVTLAAGGFLGLLPASRLPELPLTAPGVVVLLTLGLLACLAIGRARTHIPARPRATPADLFVIAGAALTWAVLAAPYLGVGVEGVLLDLARGYDNVTHFALVSGMLDQATAAPTTSDGTASIMAGYPTGLHTLGALAVLLVGPGTSSAAALVGFAVVSTLAASAVVALLGWTAVEVAQHCTPARPRTAGLVTAAVVVIAAPLGGMVAGPFEIGHTPFLYPVAVVAAASWLVLRLRSQPALATTLLVTCAVGAYLAYPPVASGLLVAAGALASRALGRSGTRWIGLAAGVSGVLGLLVLGRWHGTLAHVAVATGEVSTPTLTVLLATLVSLALTLLARAKGVHPWPGLAWAAPAGLALAAAALGCLSWLSGFPPLDNYYVSKLLQAAWVAQFPLLAGLCGWAVVLLTEPVPPQVRRAVVVGAAATAGLLLAAVPDGRYPGRLGGVELAVQRSAEAAAAHDQVAVVAAGEAVGPAADDVALMVDPPGWSLPVAGVVKADRSASLWLNSLRGLLSTRQAAAAACLGDWREYRTVTCLEDWLAASPSSQLILLVSPGSAHPALEELARLRPDQVRWETVSG